MCIPLVVKIDVLLMPVIYHMFRLYVQLIKSISAIGISYDMQLVRVSLYMLIIAYLNDNYANCGLDIFRSTRYNVIQYPERAKSASATN